MQNKMSSKWVVGLWVLALGCVFGYRLVLCLQAPEDTSDLFRHLGYSSHLLSSGLDFYQTTPRDFQGEFWTQFWPDQSYIYPPGILLVFSFFSSLGAGLAVIKMAFTAFDLATALLIGRLIDSEAHPLLSRVASLLVFAAPISLWYTSHEGQYEALLAFALALTALGLGQKKWLRAGAAWAIALQLKQLGLLLAPLLLAELLREEPKERAKAARVFAKGFVFGTLPFLPFYLVTPELWLRPMKQQGWIRFNPFHWNFLEPSWFDWNPPWLIQWNAVATYAILALVTGFMIWRLLKRGGPQEKALVALSALPLFSFWTLLKSLTWAEFWYPILSPALSLGLKKWPRLFVLLLVGHCLQDGRSIALLTGPAFGVRELQTTIDHFTECRWHCDYQAPLEAQPSPQVLERSTGSQPGGSGYSRGRQPSISSVSKDRAEG